MERKNIWTTYTKQQLQELDSINEKYKACLDAGKTERECVDISIRMAEQAGYRNPGFLHPIEVYFLSCRLPIQLRLFLLKEGFPTLIIQVFQKSTPFPMRIIM